MDYLNKKASLLLFGRGLPQLTTKPIEKYSQTDFLKYLEVGLSRYGVKYFATTRDRQNIKNAKNLISNKEIKLILDYILKEESLDFRGRTIKASEYSFSLLAGGNLTYILARANEWANKETKIVKRGWENKDDTSNIEIDF